MGNAKQGFGVIEIGAGIGVLTAELAKRAEKVICIEIDKRLLPILDETLAEFENIKIINNDVLKTDIKKIIAEEFEGLDVAICANLPYYITSPILMYLLESRLPVKSITVMVQKEAARRICAKPGTRDVGALSLAVRYYSEPKILFDVSRGSFVPSPDVDSELIAMLHSRYGKAAVLAYMRERFGNESVRYSKDMQLSDDTGYIMSLLAVLNSSDTGAFYHVEELDGSYKEGVYSIPQLRFVRKEEKK